MATFKVSNTVGGGKMDAKRVVFQVTESMSLPIIDNKSLQAPNIILNRYRASPISLDQLLPHKPALRLDIVKPILLWPSLKLRILKIGFHPLLSSSSIAVRVTLIFHLFECISLIIRRN
jgi:hypothetical protein